MQIDMNAIATKAVFDAMSDEQRQKLVQDTLTAMMNKKESGYGRTDEKSILERSIANAASLAVERWAYQWFEENEGELKKLVQGVLAAIVQSDETRNNLAQAVAKQIEKGLRGY